MKRILILIILIFIPSFTVSAESYSLDGADDLKSKLSDEAADYFYENGIVPESTDWLKNIDAENVFSHIIGFFKDGAAKPFKYMTLALGLILISSGFTAISSEKGSFELAKYVSVLSVTAVLAFPIYSSVEAAVSAIKGCSTFMLSFVPVFAATVAVSGSAASSVSTAGMLLAAAEGVSAVASFVILPIMGAYLAVGICSAVSPLTVKSGLSGSIKKTAMWILSLVTTVFLGVLSIQTAVNSATDSLSIKTAKFIIGTAVPIAGATVSEAVSTVTASMKLLKSSVGIYGILALCFILLPIIAELLLWRLALFCVSFTAGIFSDGRISALVKAFDDMLSLLIGVILLVGVMFVISLTVAISVGKGI